MREAERAADSRRRGLSTERAFFFCARQLQPRRSLGYSTSRSGILRTVLPLLAEWWRSSPRTSDERQGSGASALPVT